MSDPFARLRRFLRELKRRKVYRVAATYAVVGFVLIQVADLTFVRLGLPSWTVTFVIVLVAVGFPLSLVLAWAFEVTPEGMRRTPEAELEDAVEEETKPEAGTRTAYKVLVGLGLVAAAVAGGWYLAGGGGESPEVTEGTVAVLPFEVSGSGTEEWRDGMVSLLSTGLDGAVGLRAIADRTVLATWEQNGPGKTGATTEQALAVARQVGAQYAVLGSAAGLGSELQLSAAAYETTSGDRLGQLEVRGPADSVTALAGELTRRVLGLLAERTGEGLRAADLASVTTRSDTALRAFLAGERHRREGNTDPAIEDYEAAIRADSTFALPYARIGLLGLYHGEFRGRHMRRAYELADQLPERQRRLVRALYLGRIEHHTLAAADSLRRLTEDYPDDPSVWNSLGELIFHTSIPRGVREVETTHERAVQLDPGQTTYHDHYVLPAFSLHHDSARAASRVEAVPNDRWRRLFQLGWDVVFGDSARRQRAFAAYDTVSPADDWQLFAPFTAPQNGELLDTVVRRMLARENVRAGLYAFVLVRNDLRRGQVEQALADFRRWEFDPGTIACRLAGALTLGHPVPDSLGAQYLAPEHLPDAPSVGRLQCVGLYLMESGRSDELDSLIRRLEEVANTTGAGSVSASHRQAIVQELRGYRAWKAGDLELAGELWDRSNEFGATGAIWRGNLYRELGQLERAEGWYLAAWTRPLAQERLGQLYERLNQPEKAAAAYRRFIAAWEDADPKLQPRVEAARKRLKELTAAEADADG